MIEDDDEEVLTWKTLDVHEHHHHVHSSSGGGGGISTGTDDDVEDFSELTYDPSRAAGTHSDEHHDHQHTAHTQQHDALLHSHHHHNGQRQLVSSSSSSQHQRFKRKNFSKQLQLLCLQRYAHYAKENGKLPDKTECQYLLHQSYMQFLKEGGAADEPRLSHQEFLKLIRNRRREMYVRAQKQKLHHLGGGNGGSDASNTQQPLSAAKRKLQQEHAKIYELIEIIDQAREQSGLVPDHHHHHHLQRSERHLVVKQPPPLQPPLVPEQLADPQDQIELIFQIQQETLEIQREIADRLKVIRLHRSMRQHDSMEPSSASV